MASSHYFHSTLYQFSDKAVEAVIGSLHAALQNAAVQCHYDRDWDWYELTCPSQIGLDANGALHEVLAAYMERELGAADSEQRVPDVLRFAESIVDHSDAHATTDADDDGANGSTAREGEREVKPTASGRSLVVMEKPKAVVLHAVSDEGMESTIKMFNLRDTGPDMLERTLVHPGNEAKITICRSFTCRAARWDPVQACYVFNGRIGAPIQESEDDTGALLEEAYPFVRWVGKPQPTHDGQEAAGEGAESGIPPARVSHWRFKGKEPTVNQFLDGIGQVELLDPETAKGPSEVPLDAVKYNASPEHQVRTFRRTRRPANFQIDHDDSHDSAGDVVEPGQPTGKNALLRLKQGVTNCSSDVSDEDESTCSDDGSSRAGASNPMINRLRTAVQHTTPIADELLPRSSATDLDLVRANSTSIATGEDSVTAGSHVQSSVPGISVPTTTLPELDRSYTKVDRAGLTGHAARQAQWDLHNPMPLSRKLNKHGVVRRAPVHIENLSPQPTSGSSAPVSLQSGSERLRGQQTPTLASSFSIAHPRTMVEDYTEDQPELQPWANQKQSSAVMTDSLIDVSVPRSRDPKGCVHLPPGLEQLSEPSELTLPTSSVPPVSSRQVPSKATLDQLIDVTSDERALTKPNTMLASWHDAPLEPTARLPASSIKSFRHEDDGIVERLRDPTDVVLQVRYTMRQKASKKKKKKKAKAKKTESRAPEVHLPKPGSRPSTRQGPSNNVSESICNAGPSAATLTGTDSHSFLGLRHPDTFPQEFATSQTSLTENHIHTLITETRALHEIGDDDELVVHFGVVLVRPLNDAGFCTGNYSSSMLAKKLQSLEISEALRSEFFDRMTTSASDGAYMFDLLRGRETFHEAVEYEITVKLLNGDIRTILFEQSEAENFVFLMPYTHFATLYMHFPLRIHDARCRVTGAAQDVNADIATIAAFVASLRHTKEPSFRGLVPTKSFSVERVHVRTIHQKSIVKGVDFKVTCTRDLLLEPLHGAEGFNLAAIALDRQAMINEHRLWYECSLHLTPIVDVRADVLQDLVHKMVEKMDEVGFHNKGPYVKTEIEEEEPQDVVRFW